MEFQRANDPSSFDAILAAVRERLASRRIGFLWQGEPYDPPRAPGFTWVHYAKGAHGPRRYDLNALANPELEARSLHMLIVPAGSLPTLAEVASGILISPEAAMIDGALRAAVPVLFEASGLLPWYASAGDASRKSLCAALDALRSRGMEFPGFTGGAPAPMSAPAGRAQSPAVSLDESGWLAWTDIAERVRGARLVRLAPGARLTPEARDRLMNLKIRVIEEGP